MPGLAGQFRQMESALSFGFHGSPLLTFKTDQLDLTGLDLGKSDVLYQKPIRVETCNARSQLPNIQCELIG